jgi:hypothetical protein
MTSNGGSLISLPRGTPVAAGTEEVLLCTFSVSIAPTRTAASPSP